MRFSEMVIGDNVNVNVGGKQIEIVRMRDPHNDPHKGLDCGQDFQTGKRARCPPAPPCRRTQSPRCPDH